MVSADHFLIYPRDEDTRRLAAHMLLEMGNVTIPFRSGKIRLHELTEGTASIVNSGGNTDSFLTLASLSMFSYQQKAVFNSTLKNTDRQKELLVGFLLSYDLASVNPNTDVNKEYFDIRWYFREGAAPTYSASDYGCVEHRLAANQIVEETALNLAPYAGPFIMMLLDPKWMVADSNTYEYLGGMFFNYHHDFSAHTVATTLTLKVRATAILVDEEIAADYQTVAALTEGIRGVL